MQNEAEPHEHGADSTEPGGIVALTGEERVMLREFAEQLRTRAVRNQVAREALDRAADQLERVGASSPSEV